jgi:radical SAM superfamily enzyme
MVHDHYLPKINRASDDWAYRAFIPSPQTISPDLAALKKLLEDFQKAIAAAEIVDALTTQPDCVDP